MNPNPTEAIPDPNMQAAAAAGRYPRQESNVSSKSNKSNKSGKGKFDRLQDQVDETVRAEWEAEQNRLKQ